MYLQCSYRPKLNWILHLVAVFQNQYNHPFRKTPISSSHNNGAFRCFPAKCIQNVPPYMDNWSYLTRYYLRTVASILISVIWRDLFASKNSCLPNKYIKEYTKGRRAVVPRNGVWKLERILNLLWDECPNVTQICRRSKWKKNSGSDGVFRTQVGPDEKAWLFRKSEVPPQFSTKGAACSHHHYFKIS